MKRSDKESEIKSLVVKTIDAWRIASKELGFVIEAPFNLQHNDTNYECIGYLPNFGSRNGMIIDRIFDPTYSRTPGLAEAARNKGLYYSAVNIEIYQEFKPDIFKDALIDWGFYGDENEKPTWMKQ